MVVITGWFVMGAAFVVLALLYELVEVSIIALLLLIVVVVVEVVVVVVSIGWYCRGLYEARDV